jgi:hypothetical protein
MAIHGIIQNKGLYGSFEVTIRNTLESMYSPPDIYKRAGT